MKTLNNIKIHNVKQEMPNVFFTATSEKTCTKPLNIALAREKLELSRIQFAELLGISVRTLISWEQGIRQPSKAAQSLMKLFIKDPCFVKETLEK